MCSTAKIMKPPTETEYARGFRDGAKALVQVVTNLYAVKPLTSLKELIEQLEDPRFFRTLESAIFAKRHVREQIRQHVRKGKLPGRAGRKRRLN